MCFAYYRYPIPMTARRFRRRAGCHTSIARRLWLKKVILCGYIYGVNVFLKAVMGSFIHVLTVRFIFWRKLVIMLTKWIYPVIMVFLLLLMSRIFPVYTRGRFRWWLGDESFFSGGGWYGLGTSRPSWGPCMFYRKWLKGPGNPKTQSNQNFLAKLFIFYSCFVIIVSFITRFYTWSSILPWFYTW